MAHAALSADGDSGVAGDARGRIAELGAGAAWLVGTAAVIEVIDGVFASQPLAAAMFGAVVADLAARRAGVDWDDPTGLRLSARAKAKARERGQAGSQSAKAKTKTKADEGGAAAPAAVVDWEEAERQAHADAPSELPWATRFRWMGAGAALAIGLHALVVGIGAALGWADVHGGAPSVAALTALMPAAAHAIRDELLLRGVVLSACARAGVHPLMAIGFAGLAGGAAIALADGASASAVALAVSSGWLFAAVFRRGGAWAAVAGHALWVLAITALTRGWLVDVHWLQGRLAMGVGADGTAAWLAAGVCALAALGVCARAAAPRVVVKA